MEKPEMINNIQQLSDALVSKSPILKKEDYKSYTRLCHPDFNDSEEAKEVWRLLQRWYKGSGYLAIINGKYKVLSKIAVGETANIFACEDDYIIKVASKARNNVKIKKETKKLTEFEQNVGDNVYRKMFPEYVETIKIAGKAANVYKNTNPPLTCIDHWVKFNGRHIIWILKRGLVILDFLHVNDFTHGNINSQHILLNHQNHGLQFCGLGSISKGGSRTLDIQDFFKTVFNKYDKGEYWITQFLESVFTDEQYVPCALELYKSAENLAETIYGKPKFEVLEK